MQRLTSAYIASRDVFSNFVASTLRCHRASLGDLHETLELVDVERRIGLLIQVERHRAEADVQQVLEDRIGGPADVRGHADLLRLEVLHQLLVVGRDEVAIVVRRDEADGAVGSENDSRCPS